MLADVAIDSDLTDALWALVVPLLPPERGGRGFGRPLTHPRREIVNAPHS